jgi:pimeloyl-ACP methyl ester carboxylesterase
VTQPQLVEFDLPHLRMAALTWGPADGRLALCVHGFPDSAHSWRYVAPKLAAKGFRVVAPFTRGYAPTGPAPDGDYHAGALMTDLIALHQHLGGGDDTVLIGHDWGAWTGNGLAAYAGSPFGAYVAMALPPPRAIDITGYGLGRNARMMAIQLRMSWYVLFFQLPLLPERVVHYVIPRLWKDWSPRGANVREDVAETLAALPTTAHRKAAVSYYRAMFRFTRATPPYAGLHRFRWQLPRTPLLVLHGEQDGAMQVGYLDRVIDALPPGSRVRTIPDAGHFLQVDQPEAVYEAILEYLRVE